jgi:hypothetical protein
MQTFPIAVNWSISKALYGRHSRLFETLQAKKQEDEEQGRNGGQYKPAPMTEELCSLAVDTSEESGHHATKVSTQTSTNTSAQQHRMHRSHPSRHCGYPRNGSDTQRVPVNHRVADPPELQHQES